VKQVCVSPGVGCAVGIDQRIEWLERQAAPLRAELAPIEEELRLLTKRRQSQAAGRSGGRASRKKSKHDYALAFRDYDAWEGRRGGLKAVAECRGIPIRTLSWALARRPKD
jgi:hypothetical protein